LWAALPHRASDPGLLIVARWPGVGERDLAAEASLADLIALVTEIRNARASARLPAGDWLEVSVVVPTVLGPTFEGLRPAIERLTRARPLVRQLTPEALAADRRDGDLSVIVAGRAIEALVRPAGVDAATQARERERLERDLAEAEDRLEAARARLANEAFTAKAPPAVVEGARARETELADLVDRLRVQLGR
jgi:valyl-tRNA synthetase